MNMLSKRTSRALLVVLGLGLTISACGDDSAPQDESETRTTDAEPSPETSSSTTSEPPASTSTDPTGSSSAATTTDGSETSESSGSVDTDETGEPDTVTVLGGFSVPESAHWHAASQSWFVSNIVGETGVPDGQGWITRLDRDLEVVDAQWFEGLDSPAGLVSSASTLYVADLDRVLAIDVESAALTEQWTVTGAALLNDPALHQDGTVYVSDTFGQAIYRVRSGEEPGLVFQDPQLDGPNGLHVDGDILTILSTGSFTDFTQEAPAFRFDLSTETLTTIGDVIGKFDGIEADADGFLITDFRGQLLRLDADDELSLIRDFVTEGLVMSTADLGYDPDLRRVLIPDLFGNQVLVYDLD